MVIPSPDITAERAQAERTQARLAGCLVLLALAFAVPLLLTAWLWIFRLLAVQLIAVQALLL